MGRASRLGQWIRCVFCVAFCVVFCVVFFFYSLVDSGERSQNKEFVLKLSWPSTAEYRMMKLKKKKSW